MSEAGTLGGRSSLLLGPSVKSPHQLSSRVAHSVQVLPLFGLQQAPVSAEAQ